MQIVIDIPDNMDLRNYNIPYDILNIITNGTPLEKMEEYMDKQQKLQFEIYIYELFEQLEIDNSEKLEKMQEELEKCIEDAIYDYASDKNLEV